jgi:hypothetical protein
VTKRHAENNTGKKGKSVTSGAERRIQRGRLAKKRCKRFTRNAIQYDTATDQVMRTKRDPLR